MLRNRVRQARINLQMTQEELADRIGVTRQTIGLIEKEQYNPTITLCLHLSEVLSQPLDVLFWMEDQKHETR